MEQLLTLFSDLDIRIVYISAAVVLIAGLLSIIKKAIKLGVIALLIAAIITYGGTTINSLKEKYRFNVIGTKVDLKVDDKQYSFQLLDIKEIICTDLGNGNVRLEMISKDGDYYTQPIKLNRVLYNLLKGQVNKLDIKVTER